VRLEQEISAGPGDIPRGLPQDAFGPEQADAAQVKPSAPAACPA
jgi:hypothetical protein